MLRSDKEFVEKILVVKSEQTESSDDIENTPVISAAEQAVDELSLDDVSAKELSREEIIAAAEAAAYAE